MKREGDSPATSTSRRAYLGALFAARPQFLAYRVQDLTTAPPQIARHLLRWPLLTWTVRSADDRARAARYADQMSIEGYRP
jgi:glycerophosphoryl diester phosphodiesterase